MYDETIYSGFFENNTINGYLEILWTNGRKFIGFIDHDLDTTFGIYHSPMEYRTFVGFWKNGLRESIGKIISKDRINYYIFEKSVIVKKVLDQNEAISSLKQEEKRYINFFSGNTNLTDHILSTMKTMQ